MMDFANGMMAGWMNMILVGAVQIMLLISIKWMQVVLDFCIAVFGSKRDARPSDYDSIFTYETNTGLLIGSFLIAPLGAWIWAYQHYGDAAAGHFTGVVLGLLLICLPVHRSTWGKWRTGMDIDAQHALADKFEAKWKARKSREL